MGKYFDKGFGKINLYVILILYCIDLEDLIILDASNFSDLEDVVELVIT